MRSGESVWIDARAVAPSPAASAMTFDFLDLIGALRAATSAGDRLVVNNQRSQPHYVLRCFLTQLEAEGTGIAGERTSMADE